MDFADFLKKLGEKKILSIRPYHALSGRKELMFNFSHIQPL
jgi:hypothetical protein